MFWKKTPRAWIIVLKKTRQVFCLPAKQADIAEKKQRPLVVQKREPTYQKVHFAPHFARHFLLYFYTQSLTLTKYYDRWMVNRLEEAGINSRLKRTFWQKFRLYHACILSLFCVLISEISKTLQHSYWRFGDLQCLTTPLHPIYIYTVKPLIMSPL